jgi:hypothetical protein
MGVGACHWREVNEERDGVACSPRRPGAGHSPSSGIELEKHRENAPNSRRRRWMRRWSIRRLRAEMEHKGVKFNPNNYRCKYCGEVSTLHLLMAFGANPKQALRCRSSPTKKHVYEEVGG